MSAALLCWALRTAQDIFSLRNAAEPSMNCWHHCCGVSSMHPEQAQSNTAPGGQVQLVWTAPILSSCQTLLKTQVSPTHDRYTASCGPDMPVCVCHEADAYLQL